MTRPKGHKKNCRCAVCRNIERPPVVRQYERALHNQNVAAQDVARSPSSANRKLLRYWSGRVDYYYKRLVN